MTRRRYVPRAPCLVRYGLCLAAAIISVAMFWPDAMAEPRGTPLPPEVPDVAVVGTAGDDDAPPNAVGIVADAETPSVTTAAVLPEPAEPVEVAKPKNDVAHLCGLILDAADQYGVPREFFIRLIWKESRFNPGAVSPVGAQGIAQFMPTTARIRGLDDPFDPVQALPASAAFLADLERRFGSWGLAAAAYNGGPNRIDPFVAGDGGLPYETQDYVFSITGRSVGYFRAKAREAATAAWNNEPVILEPVAPAALPEVPEGAIGGTIDDPLPRTRPDYTVDVDDCPKLVAALGRARATPRPAGGGGWTRWGAQVAGHPKRSVAMRQYARVKARLPADLVAQGPTVIVRRFAARGRRPIHAVQFAAPNRAAARAMCKRIAAARTPCVVVRNG